ncbi:MAG: cation:proton antiporter [Prevotellaceae bacterium]|jgi:CPA2 family monovalent cation:H+ antiporter-2|nr:cation:proton antiporter [Prevotellaceae bacterium]
MEEGLHLVSDLALILIAAGVTTIIFKWLKQPLVLGYIVAGFLVGPHFDFFPGIIAKESVAEWSELGIIFLLFALGLEFSFKKLVKVGASAFVTAATEVVTMFLVGFVVGKLFDWTTMECIFLGGMLSMSSTTIIIKAFGDLGLRNQKFTTIVFGTLIVEDLVAILLMVLLSTAAVSQQFAGAEMAFSFLKLGFFLILWFLVGIYVLPSLFRRARRLMNDETLLIISIGLCFGMVTLATSIGFSAALGAFIMGSILAETIEGKHIEHLIKNTKDLFGAVFFVSVGMLVDPGILVEHWLPILVLTLVTIFGKSLFSSIGVLISGQSLKTSIQSGFSLAQIGEFAFIIASLGYSLGVMSEFIYPVIVAVSVITTFTTPYFIRLAEPFYTWLTPRLSPRTKNFLDRYASGTNTVNTESDWRKLLKSYITNIILYSVMLIAVILCFTKYINPLIDEWLTEAFSRPVVNLINAILAFAAMTPFLLGLLTMSQSRREIFQKLLRENRYNKGKLAALLIVRVMLALFFVMAMLLYTLRLPLWAVLLIALAAFVILYLLRKRLQGYQLLQARFLYNLNQKEEIEKTKNPISSAVEKHLSGRDIHFADVIVSADSPFIGRRIKTLDVRKNYGVNIVRIKRGNTDIFFPSGEERLYPADHIVAIGTDEQINSFTAVMEQQIMCEPVEKPEVNLASFVVQNTSSVLGKTIADSKIRDAGCLVVGIDRNFESVMNPDRNFVFEEGDIVWIVGKREDIYTFRI